jgi:predicted CxxxxCH...CXXCH cytochrome family protein
MKTSAAATGDHIKHAQTRAIACATCHNGYTETTSAPLTHIDGNVNLTFSGVAVGTVYSQGTAGPLGNGFGSCTTSACHSSGQSSTGAATGLTYGTVTWGGTITCAGCHKDMKTDPAAPGDHVVHAQTRSIACATCHTGYTETTATPATHVNNNVDVALTGVAAGGVYSQGTSSPLGNGYGNCSSTSCHSSGQGSQGAFTGMTYAQITWGSGATTCGSCHKNMDTDTTAPGDHVVHAQTRNIACATCHNGYTETTAAPLTHADHNVDLSFSGKAAGTVYSQGNVSPLGNGYGSCTTSACHSSGQSSLGAATGLTYGTATWGLALTCASCHVDMKTSAAATGDHIKHAQTQAIACAICHNGYTETTSAPLTHVDGNVNLTFSGKAVGTVYSQGTAGPLGNGFGSCTTSACHSSGQSSLGAATGLTYGTATWGLATTCASCHVDMKTSATATGDHIVHAQTRGIACATCHNGYTETTVTPATHVDGNVNLTFSGKAVGTVYSQGTAGPLGNGFGSCTTSACHSSGQSSLGAATGLTYGTATWGQAVTCGSCHVDMKTSAAATGDHIKHAQTQAIACATCHSGYTETTSAPLTHVDGNVNLTFSGKAVGTVYSQGTAGVLGNGFGSCTTSACHSSGQSSLGAATGLTYGTATWGLATTCASCHVDMKTSAVATGDHIKHAQTRAIACATCHNGYTETTVTPATHVDGNVNLSFSGTAAGTVYSQGTAGPLGNGFGSCTTSACHSSGQGSLGQATGLTYGTVTWNGAVTCASCHKDMDTDPAATGGHLIHAQGARNISCATCHNGYTETTATPATHINNNVDLSFSGAGAGSVYSQGTSSPLGNGFGTCATQCHNAPVSKPRFTAPAVTWGASLNCDGCHGYPVPSVSHQVVLAGSCNGCHNNVKAGSTVTSDNTIFVNLAEHMDGTIQGGACNSCHGYPPVRSMVGRGINASYSTARIQNYSGGGGVHDVAGHILPSVKLSNYASGQEFSPCLTCHPSGATHNQASASFGGFSTQFVQVVVDPKFKFDKNRPIVYTAKQSGTGKTTGTCNNVECHLQKSPVWSSETYTQRH